MILFGGSRLGNESTMELWFGEIQGQKAVDG